MPDHNVFKGFFSYSHHDAITDPDLATMFTEDLENRINAKLANARFVIWHDKEGLRTGNRWNDKIEAEIRSSDILIVLLTPRWIESDYTRKEYSIFKELEMSRQIGDFIVPDCIAPILIRSIDRQEKHLTAEQREIYDDIKERQYMKCIVTSLLEYNEAERSILIDKIADDIEGIIERLRALPKKVSHGMSHLPTLTRSRARKEFTRAAHDFNSVDFISSAEVLIEKHRNNDKRKIYAQVDFVERLYVQSAKARINFCVARAYLSIENNELPDSLLKLDDFRSRPTRYDAYYVIRQDMPDAISICIDPAYGKSALAELALPPAPGENYWSHIATAVSYVEPAQLKAELSISLSADGLHFTNKDSLLSNPIKNKIKAIMSVAARKDGFDKKTGRIRRSISVGERD